MAALADPDPQVRGTAALDLLGYGSDALAAVPRLLAMFRDADRMAAARAQIAVHSLGDAIVPLLQDIRTGGPGLLRASALMALAEIGGEGALSPRDVAAVERLIRIKLRNDQPEPMSGCWLYWIAVAGGDQDGIMQILGLTDARSVTFALGNDIVDADAHGLHSDEPGNPYGRVFVTPELDGWTLVAGRWCDPCDDETLDLCVELSAKYGRAQAYYFGAQGDGSAWLIAEGGQVVRRYVERGDAEDPQWALGEPLAVEDARRTELGLEPDDEDWHWETWRMAPRIAAALSIDPQEIGPATLMRGTPMIALTPAGVAEGVRRGAYRI